MIFEIGNVSILSFQQTQKQNFENHGVSYLSSRTENLRIVCVLRAAVGSALAKLTVTTEATRALATCGMPIAGVRWPDAPIAQ